MNDFDFWFSYDGGTIALLMPISAAAKQWIDDYVEALSWLGHAVAIEHRYIDNIMAGVNEAGFTVKNVSPS